MRTDTHTPQAFANFLVPVNSPAAENVRCQRTDVWLCIVL